MQESIKSSCDIFGQKEINSESQLQARRRRFQKDLQYQKAWNVLIPKFSLVMCVIASCLSTVYAVERGTGHLDGVGYREQELQVAKGNLFQSEEAKGVLYASYGGGTHIFIKGVGLVDDPQSNSVLLFSNEFEQEISSTPLTEDDAFNSHPMLGSIAYRLPSLEELFGQPMAMLGKYNSMTFYLSISAFDPDLGPVRLSCKVKENCKVVYQRDYTPVIYYLSPPVVYYSAYTELWFDPKSTQNLISNLDSDEMPFINAKLGGSLLDFEFLVEDTTTFSGWNRNRVKGQVGELPAGKNYNISMMWETGKSQILRQEATFCSYDNQTCYQARSVPVIFGTSSNIGYHTGGMNLTVHGYGFDSGKIVAKVDGEDCVVTSFYEYSFSCRVSGKTNASISNSSYVGSNGLRRKLINESRGLSYNVLDSYAATNETLALSFENPFNEGNFLGNVYKGWFVAPATTRYRFYITCDDLCKLNLGNTSGQSENTTELVSNNYHTDHRDWWDTEARNQQYKRTSDWISLTAGEHYYMEGWHYEGTGGDHFATAVEIEQSDIIGHHHSMKEVQYISVEAEQIFETTRINITKMDQGEFILVFTNPNDLKTTVSEAMSASATANQVRIAVQSYYQSNPYIRSNINTNLTWFDANGTETTNQTEAVTSVYYITLRRLIDGSSASSIRVVKTTTKATITVDLPSAVQLSGPPLRGNYRIKCNIKEGYEPQYSYDLGRGNGANRVNINMGLGCYSINDLTEVYETNDYEYNDNGVAWIIRFLGHNEDPGQFEIVSSENNPLTGGNITYRANTTVPYSSNLFYEPIPFEMIRTYETEPQLIVTVGDQPAVCHNLTCDFTYILPEGNITAFTYTESTKKLVITGNNLPTILTNITSVEFAQSLCSVDEATLSNTTVECTLNNEPTCGDYKPILTTLLGIIPVVDGVDNQTILCTVSGASPNTGLNLLGGDNITISGQYLPRNLETNTVSIKFTDTQQTDCVAQVSSSSALVCLTSAFDKSVSAGQSLQMTIVINGQTVSNSITVTMKTEIKSSLTLNPSSVSPVLKTKIVVQLDSDFPNTLTKESLSMNATSTTNSSYVRYLNVIEVDDTAKTFTAMFGGAYSGQFHVSIRHTEYGLVGTEGLILDVSASVTSYSPTSGSIYGGTLLTITGTNFGDVYTDNPVQISNNGGIGSIDCFVQETSATQIKCRIDSGLNKIGGDEDTMVVFLKTSEEAVCDPRSKCVFTWNSWVPQLASVDLQFENSTSQWQLKVTGTGLTGDTNSVELYIANVKQTTTSVSSTEAVFSITNVTSQTLNSQKLYFDIGIPANHSLVETSFNMTPKLVSISPNSGSIGGSLITVQAPGVTVSQIVSIVDSEGNSVCQSVSVKEYGVVECKTLAKEMNSTQLSVKQGSTTYACVNTDTSLCQYEQLSTSSFPAVTSTTKTDTNIVFTGTNFDIADFTASAAFAGVSSDSVVIDSSTQATATFNLGVPTVSTDQYPEMVFTKASVVHYAPSAAALANALSVSSSTSGLQCSFAGECSYEVTSTGLSSIIKQNETQNYISVCDEKCVFDESSSSATVTKCKVPKISTVYSNSNFGIATPTENLKAGNYFGTATDFALAFDDKMLETPTDDSTICHMGMTFKQGHVGMLSQVKYFMKDITSKELFVNTTKFQGSNDGSSYTDLFEMDENLHEGWNYFKWEDATQQPKYRYYRFYANKKGACAINEITLTGIETIDNSDATYSCSANLVTGESTTSLNPVEYTGSLTPSLTGVSPRFGTVTGGTVVTFTGTGLSTDTSKYSIIIDGINCPVSSATSTSVTCTTGKRPGLVETSLRIYIDGHGLVSNREIVFRYVSVWSSDTTWGGEFAPMEGESVWIPKGLNLLVDVDSSPVLKAVIVEGSLIFAPEVDATHHRFFDAHYIFINGGLMEVGTEEFPYTSKITITMHSAVTDPYIPIYGNKVIGVRYGTLDMHGPVRTPTWTTLETTVQAGGTVITLSEEVDWQVGEEISIASTSFEGREGEKRTISAIDSTKKVITLDQPLDFKHFAAIETYGDDSIDMRAEVGLLSRNVRYRGDPETSAVNEYGATIFMHSNGDDSLTARLSYIECTLVGQAFKVGRYAIHFHMIGAVHKSYAKGLGIHQGFNRAFTLHGTHYLRLEQNVAFEIKGHTVFIEDAVETNNYMYKNLIMKTMRSMSLLNTDQTPACFWITHPNNIFIDNHAAGADRYGFWYDLQTHAIGPSSNTNVCPENDRVGEFRGNHAHSMGRYGLRIFHNMVPRKYPCKPIVYDENVPENPYWKNPPITAYFRDFTGWKNNRNGAIAERVGDVRFINFKTADNLLAGIEFSLTDEFGDDMAQIDGALIIGKTSNTENKLNWSNPHGIITPRTENFQVKNVKFYNFDFNQAACLGSCSHCFHGAATDSGARTVTFRNLQYTNVTKKIRYQYPWKAIYYDLDGTLTGKGPQTYATFYYPFHDQPECEHKAEEYNGVVCDNTVAIRRVAFHNWKPSGLLSGMGFKVLKYDDEFMGAMDNVTRKSYIDTKSNYGTIIFQSKLDPTNGWAVPFVTGHKYKIHWGQTGLDFEQMQMTMSERWLENDKSIHFVHNFTDVRAAVEVRFNGVLVENNTIQSNEANHEPGHNLILNDTETREIHVVVNGKHQNSNPYKESKILMNGIRCIGSCTENIIEVEEPEAEFRFWSDVKNWPNETLPVDGEDVHILSGWKMIIDIEETPIIQLLRVNGILIFSDEMDVHLRSKHIFVRAGELHIGNETHPYQHNALITLYGEKNSGAIVYDNAIEAGNKVLANVNVVKMFGKDRMKKMTRLHAEANKGDTQITVEPGLDLVAGDRIALAATSYHHHAGDYSTLTGYDNVTGLCTLNTALEWNHWGAPESTASKYNGVDIRGEVLLLSRNIQIRGEDIESWGCQIVTSDTIEFDTNTFELKERKGQMLMNNVEVYNCSQIDTFKAAIRFEGASQKYSSITNSSFHNGYGWGANIKNSANILLQNNLWFNFRPIGVAIDFSRNITFDNNVVAKVVERTTIEADPKFVDKGGAVAVCSYHESTCQDISVTNNIAAGSLFAGFIVMGHDCGDTNSRVFRNNVAHSIAGNKMGHGALIYPDPAKPSHSQCYEGSHFTGYKCYYQGAFGAYKSQKVKFSQMTMIDNGHGFGASLGASQGSAVEYAEMLIELSDNKIYGETEISDCPADGSFCKPLNKFGMMLAGSCFKGKALHLTALSDFPVHSPMSGGTWGVVQKMYRNEFIGFDSETKLGMRQSAMENNPLQSDYFPMMEFFDNTFTDVKNIAYMAEPNPGWANLKDCGDFPCTAPLNSLISFQGTVFKGSKPRWAKSEFQVIANNTGFSPYIEECDPYVNINGYICDADKMGVLLFESEDDDKWDRSMQPIYVKKQGTEMENKLNSYMDHVWDGFYSGQVRLSRFPSVIQANRGSVHDLNFTGSPAKKFRFTLRSQIKTAGTTIRIAYPSAESRAVYVDGQLIQPNQWDDNIQMYGEIKQKFCGENRYIGVKNILEFYITQNCNLQIKPRNAIQSLVRMEWTMEAFFADGGTTKFVDRLTASLGIHASNVKVVSVYEGSLIVNYEISVDDDDEDALAEIQKTQDEKFSSGAVNLGAPVLAYEAKVSLEASTSNKYTPVTISAPTYSQSNTNDPNVFNPNINIVTEKQVTYKNNTMQVELENEAIIKTETVIIESPRETKIVKVTGEKSNTGLIIMAIAFVMIVLVITYFVIRKLLFKQRFDKIEIEKKIQMTNEKIRVEPTSEMKLEDSDAKPIKTYDILNRFSMDASMQQYEQQYDPNNDFRIFGCGDPTKGGIQDMKEKMNMADKPVGSEESSDEEVERQSSGAPSATVLDSNLGSKQSSAQSTGGNRSQTPMSNQLPEDKEIQESSDDE